MDFMNVYFVLVALLLVLVIGGYPIDIWDLLFYNKPLDGLLTLEMNILKKELNISPTILDWMNVNKLECAQSLAPKD
jgi:hypothetical protein